MSVDVDGVMSACVAILAIIVLLGKFLMGLLFRAFDYMLSQRVGKNSMSGGIDPLT